MNFSFYLPTLIAVFASSTNAAMFKLNGVMNAAAAGLNSLSSKATTTEAAFKIPDYLSKRFTSTVNCPGSKEEMLARVFSKDATASESALYCPRSVEFLTALNPTGTQVMAATIPDADARKNGILALMKKFVRLNDIYLPLHMQKRFNECMQNLVDNAPGIAAHYKDPAKPAMPVLAACQQLPTFDAQMAAFVNAQASTDANAFKAALIKAANSSKPFISPIANVANERAARENLKLVLEALKGVTPAYSQAEAAFEAVNGVGRKYTDFKAGLFVADGGVI